MLHTLVSGAYFARKQLKKNLSSLLKHLKYQKHLKFLAKISLGNSSCAILHAQQHLSLGWCHYLGTHLLALWCFRMQKLSTPMPKSPGEHYFSCIPGHT